MWSTGLLKMAKSYFSYSFSKFSLRSRTGFDGFSGLEHIEDSSINVKSRLGKHGNVLDFIY